MNRPGFEHLFFRRPTLSRVQNGYTELAKLMLTKTQHYHARELDDPVCEQEYSKFFSQGMEYCFSAESTTLTCQYDLVDESRSLENPRNRRNYRSIRESKCVTFLIPKYLSLSLPTFCFTCGGNWNLLLEIQPSIPVWRNPCWFVFIGRQLGLIGSPQQPAGSISTLPQWQSFCWKKALI